MTGRALGAVSAVAGLVMSVACATTLPFIDTHPSISVKTSDSRTHGFKYVKIAQDGGALVVHGKVAHNHDICEHDGHVDLAISTPDGTIVHAVTMPLSQGRHRVHGWYGAAFRAKFAFRLAPEHVVSLALHGARCFERELGEGSHPDVDGGRQDNARQGGAAR